MGTSDIAQGVAGKRSWLAAAGWILLGLFALAAPLIGDIYGESRTIGGRTVLSIRLWQYNYAVGAIGYALVLVSCRSRPAGRWGIVVGAILLRIPLLLCAPNSDVNRYAWEGRIQGLGFNPYLTGPLDPALEPYRDDVWEGVNKKKFSTIYPPLAELSYRAMSAVHYGIKTPQVVHTLLDIAVILVLMALLAAMRRPDWYIAIYALSPLTLAAFAHAGHNDTLMILPLLGFIAAARVKRWRLAGLSLGLAVLAKTTPIPLLALLVRKSKAAVAIALGIIVLGYLIYAEAGWKLFETLRTFPADGPFNSLPDELRRWFNSWSGVRFLSSQRMIAAAVLMAGATIYRTIRPRDILTDTRWLIALVVLLMPIIHFWYLTWPLALITLAPRGYWSWLVLAITTAVYWQSDWAGQAGHPWRLEPGWVALYWAPFFVAWAIEALATRGRGNRRTQPS